MVLKETFKTPASEKEAKEGGPKRTTAVGGFSLYPEKFNKYVEGKKKT